MTRICTALLCPTASGEAYLASSGKRQRGEYHADAVTDAGYAARQAHGTSSRTELDWTQVRDSLFEFSQPYLRYKAYWVWYTDSPASLWITFSSIISRTHKYTHAHTSVTHARVYWWSMCVACIHPKAGSSKRKWNHRYRTTVGFDSLKFYHERKLRSVIFHEERHPHQSFWCFID